MRDRILETLAGIEHTHNVIIFYACEAGSRAWGFPSPDSDWDVRFLYYRLDWRNYLKLDIPRDVIELPIADGLDIYGWDLFKTLRLLRKSNPALLEWLFAPVIYWERHTYVEELRQIARSHFSGNAMVYHYLHLLKGNYNQFIRGRDVVWLKKYLYVIRPLVFLIYLTERHDIPPIDFMACLQDVQDRVDPAVVAAIGELVAAKKISSELLDDQPAIPILNQFIEDHIAQWETPPRDWEKDWGATDRLNELLQKMVGVR